MAGYAGLFGLWTFAKPVLTDKTTDVIGFLLGLSLFIYISWELYSMIVRANGAYKFVELVNKEPSDFFAKFGINEKHNQAMTARFALRWRLVVVSAGLLAYSGGLLLLYNILANLFRLSPWP